MEDGTHNSLKRGFQGCELQGVEDGAFKTGKERMIEGGKKIFK